MKYIRTKGGKIIKILKEGIDEFGKYGMVDEENCIRNYDDLKQADTIEELIEGIVAIRKSDNFKLLYTDSHIEEAIKYYKGKLKDFNVFGVIWTDKGLIYIARMNDKGELELL